MKNESSERDIFSKLDELGQDENAEKAEAIVDELVEKITKKPDRAKKKSFIPWKVK